MSPHSEGLTHARKPTRQLTERYISAIHQLGTASLDIRLGEIYALERFAKDSPDEQPIVVGVLSAVVRAYIPGRSGTGHGRQNQPRSARAADGRNGQLSRHMGPDADIQAALTVLGRLPSLPGVCRAELTDAHLSHAQLERADLAGAQLERVDLSGAQLEWADLSGAQLERADLSGTRLKNTTLTGARLGGADLTRATGLRQEQLEAAVEDGTTVVPVDFVLPASWLN
ncbi:MULTISPECIES: pentapeptide repeat-containing protein [unclassified Frankia]|uniref:pentapeptide repeat-containing protein n=1 Tax=unclassified Frankia TaxID=2632575 RepID=UPI002AD53120|nr:MULTISPECIES: pentapeptide repeat-containing protein [unclassified Frankia]